jgi:hypothetical protein
MESFDLLEAPVTKLYTKLRQAPNLYTPISAEQVGGGAIVRYVIASSEKIIVHSNEQFFVADQLILEGAVELEDGGILAIL